MKKKYSRFLSILLCAGLILGIAPVPAPKVKAAETATVTVNSLGNKGTVTYGSKKKTGTWFKMNVSGRRAFCINLGKACHNGNSYEKEESYSWNQSTGGEKHGFYAKIIRWYVVDKKRTNKAFVMAQALIWSIAEERNSKSQLKDVISQVQKNTGYYTSRTAAQLYEDIFEPSGNWTAEATIWKKANGSASYQRILVVDAGTVPTCKFVSDNTYYRQRITVMKKDEDEKGVEDIQFTLKADNLDDLYSFSMTDKSGTENSDDQSDETEFSMTGRTTSTGRIAWRMTYWLQSQEYAYYPDSELAKMDSDEKKAAKKYLTDDLDLTEGVDFASDMSKTGADQMIADELMQMKNHISNSYTLTEDNVGANKHLIVDPTYAKGVNITLTEANSWERNSDGSWPDMAGAIHSDYEKAYKTDIYNKYKKASFTIKKLDKDSSDHKAHGDATLDGAVFRLYEDAACTKPATVYKPNGGIGESGAYIIENGTAETEYLRSGVTYYLKEVEPPEGYLLNTDVEPITVDASSQTNEYTSHLFVHEKVNTAIKGKVALQKYINYGQTGQLNKEINVTFQIYLTRKGSYDACDEYERATVTTDKNGYAITGDLYYGDYTVHQVDTGGEDTEKVADFYVTVNENGKTWDYHMGDLIFKAYLRILKKDANTEKQVLKSGTTYQIYSVDKAGNETLVEQEYVDGNKRKKISQFVTDESGEIMTVSQLESGTYRIYETDSATGLHITTKYIEVEINSQADNYETYADSEGHSHAVVTLTYTNEETYGKLKIFKSGEMLSDYKDGKFFYEKKFLKGVTFEIYADGDIVTQDAQGTNWFNDKELVATVTTGEKAVFTKDCPGITGYTVEEDGTVTLNLPLGKYKVKEKKTLYGYVLSDTEWPVEFNWQNKDDEFVLDATDTTDENGVLSVVNERAKPKISLKKTDSLSQAPIKDVRFGIYTKDDIYNADGKKIVSAGEKLGEMTTDKNGAFVCDMDLPLMSESYEKETETDSETASGSAVSVETDSSERTVNSGDYYLREISVSGSYYLDASPIPVHLAYEDEQTPVIEKKLTVTNSQTAVEISKTEIAGSGEISGCLLQISDEEGNGIVSWTSGTEDYVVLADEDSGYQNFSTSLTESKRRMVYGLLQNKTYILTEIRPADGYVTTDSIAFQLQESTQEAGKTLVSIRNESGEFVLQNENIVHMVDEKTTVTFEKKNKDKKLLGGAEMEVYDSSGKKVAEFTTKKGKSKTFSGVFKVGETYTFKEVSAPDGYDVAKPVTYTVKDTKDEQIVTMTDKKLGLISTKVPKDFFEGKNTKSPKTGYFYLLMLLLAGVSFGSGAGILAWKKGRKGYAKKEK